MGCHRTCMAGSGRSWGRVNTIPHIYGSMAICLKGDRDFVQLMHWSLWFISFCYHLELVCSNVGYIFHFVWSVIWCLLSLRIDLFKCWLYCYPLIFFLLYFHYIITSILVCLFLTLCIFSFQFTNHPIDISLVFRDANKVFSQDLFYSLY